MEQSNSRVVIVLVVAIICVTILGLMQNSSRKAELAQVREQMVAQNAATQKMLVTAQQELAAERLKLKTQQDALALAASGTGIFGGGLKEFLTEMFKVVSLVVIGALLILAGIVMFRQVLPRVLVTQAEAPRQVVAMVPPPVAPQPPAPVAPAVKPLQTAVERETERQELIKKIKAGVPPEEEHDMLLQLARLSIS